MRTFLALKKHNDRDRTSRKIKEENIEGTTIGGISALQMLRRADDIVVVAENKKYLSSMLRKT